MNTSNIKNYKPKDFAELLGVSVKTLQRWDREDILKAYRSPTNRRYYTYDQYVKFKGGASTCLLNMRPTCKRNTKHQRRYIGRRHGPVSERDA